VLGHAEPPEIAPEGVVFGSVQVPGEGLPIVLGPDGPVTGGYPKIATVVGPDLPRLGQAAPGTVLRFSAVAREGPSAPRGSTMSVP
jgi:allophanate hydrolase subunit 2